MKLDPEPTQSEIRASRIYCAIVALLTLIPAAIAFQLAGPSSWQFSGISVLALVFLLAAFMLPARICVFVTRFVPWPWA